MIRNSVYFFVTLALIAVAGFWPSYFSRVHEETELRVHLHGAVMSMWLLMLIGQSYLIRSDRRALHRLVGKVSYLLVPLIVFSTLTLERFRLQESVGGLTPELLYFVYVVLSLVGLFMLAYAWRCTTERTPQLHMRYMACTALPLIDPYRSTTSYQSPRHYLPYHAGCHLRSDRCHSSLADLLGSTTARPGPGFSRDAWRVSSRSNSHVLFVRAAVVAHIR